MREYELVGGPEDGNFAASEDPGTPIILFNTVNRVCWFQQQPHVVQQPLCHKYTFIDGKFRHTECKLIEDVK